jgi:hypothetical protein
MLCEQTALLARNSWAGEPDGALPAATSPVKPGQELIYRASWMGVPVGIARLTFGSDDKSTSLSRGVALVQTNRAADALYKMHDQLCEDFDADSFAPRLMEIFQHENHTFNQYTVTFSEVSGRIETLRRTRRGAQHHDFQLKNAFGPISAALKILSQPLEVGRSRSVLVFTGTSYYLVELSVVRRERIASAMGNADTFLTGARVVRSSDGSAAESVHNVALWISAGENHLPLRAEAMTFVGPVRADLVSVAAQASPRATHCRRMIQANESAPLGLPNGKRNGSDGLLAAPSP